MTDVRVARLATTGADLQPHLVPVTFAITGDIVVTAIDQKPKSTTNLRRLRNIDQNPKVSLLWDSFDEDWSQLWWVRADGHAQIRHHGVIWHDAVENLQQKYPQYQEAPPPGPVIVITVRSWSGWAST